MKQNTVYYLFAVFFPNNRLSNHRWWSEIKKLITVEKGRNSFLWNIQLLKHEESVQQQWVKSEFDKYALESNGRL
jgi:hypothetical protein